MEVQRSVRGHVGQYRAVVAASAEGEVVDAGHPRPSPRGSPVREGALTSRREVPWPTRRPARPPDELPSGRRRPDPRRQPAWRRAAPLCGLVSPAICSANFATVRAGFSQRKRRPHERGLNSTGEKRARARRSGGSAPDARRLHRGPERERLIPDATECADVLVYREAGTLISTCVRPTSPVGHHHPVRRRSGHRVRLTGRFRRPGSSSCRAARGRRRSPGTRSSGCWPCVRHWTSSPP